MDSIIGPETSEASGFIVDAEKGIILTNRHVACAGPFVGEAICHDHEEVDVFPIYRDPVHDFGFLKYGYIHCLCHAMMLTMMLCIDLIPPKSSTCQ